MPAPSGRTQASEAHLNDRLRAQGLRVPTLNELKREARAQGLADGDMDESEWTGLLRCVLDQLFEKPLPQAIRDCITGKGSQTGAHDAVMVAETAEMVETAEIAKSAGRSAVPDTLSKRDVAAIQDRLDENKLFAALMMTSLPAAFTFLGYSFKAAARDVRPPAKSDAALVRDLVKQLEAGRTELAEPQVLQEAPAETLVPPGANGTYDREPDVVRATSLAVLKHGLARYVKRDFKGDDFDFPAKDWWTLTASGEDITLDLDPAATSIMARLKGTVSFDFSVESERYQFETDLPIDIHVRPAFVVDHEDGEFLLSVRKGQISLPRTPLPVSLADELVEAIGAMLPYIPVSSLPTEFELPGTDSFSKPEAKLQLSGVEIDDRHVRLGFHIKEQVLVPLTPVPVRANQRSADQSARPAARGTPARRGGRGTPATPARQGGDLEEFLRTLQPLAIPAGTDDRELVFEHGEDSSEGGVTGSGRGGLEAEAPPQPPAMAGGGLSPVQVSMAATINADVAEMMKQYYNDPARLEMVKLMSEAIRTVSTDLYGWVKADLLPWVRTLLTATYVNSWGYMIIADWDRLVYRLSQVDDEASLSISADPIGSARTRGERGYWDLVERPLRPGVHLMVVTLKNSGRGQFSARLDLTREAVARRGQPRW